MSFNQIMPALGILVAIISAFVPSEWWTLILLAIGLVQGFGAPEEDTTTIVLVVVAAVAFPTIANSLDAIPVVGGYLNTIIDHFAIAIGGYFFCPFFLGLKKRNKPATVDLV